MGRFYVQILLERLHTLTSGDLGNQGEWFIKVNKKGRFPSTGVLLLSKNETYVPPDPKPSIYTAVVDDKEKHHQVKIQVKEEDTLSDDLMLEQDLNLDLTANKDAVHDFKSKDGKVELKVRIIVTRNDQI